MRYKRLLVAVVLLAASGVLAQTTVTLEQQCNPRINTCAFLDFQTPPPGTQVTVSPPPSPVWVADPSAGHYDCPDGWAAYTRSEPEVYSPGRVVPANLSYYPPTLDKKGHVLHNQPSASICIQEKP